MTEYFGTYEPTEVDIEGESEMPKVTLTFNLPEEQYEYAQVLEASTMASIIYDFTQVVRAKTKYGDGKLVSWEDVRTEWHNILTEEGYDPYAE